MSIFLYTGPAKEKQACRNEKVQARKDICKSRVVQTCRVHPLVSHCLPSHSSSRSHHTEAGGGCPGWCIGSCCAAATLREARHQRWQHPLRRSTTVRVRHGITSHGHAKRGECHLRTQQQEKQGKGLHSCRS